MKVIKNNLLARILAKWAKKWQKKLGSKGFSLIELLVVVGIIGVLAAVAVPAYQGYKKDAALVAMSSDSNSISKAFLACTTVKTFGNCDTLTKIGVSITGATEGKDTPKFCAHFDREIGGVKYQQCVSADASTGIATIKNSASTCYENKGALVCALATIGTTCDQASPITPCTSDANCTAAGVGTICNTGGDKGTCGATTGVCT